jgi:amino acid adenylation domain-containing protein
MSKSISEQTLTIDSDYEEGPESHVEEGSIGDVYVLPVSSAQRRLWFLSQLEGESARYNLPGALRLTGSLNTAALERSFNEVLRRHESLRTSFAIIDNQPVQLVSPTLSIALEMIDLRPLADDEKETEVRARIREESRRPFDLSRPPMFRALLLRTGDEEHVLLFTMHHIASDGWSIRIFVREMAALYSAFIEGKSSPLSEPPIQYADFAIWEREWLQDDVLAVHLAYWKEQLDGELPLLNLQFDRPRPAVQTFHGARQAIALPASLLEELEVLSRQEGVTLFMTLLGAFQTLLHRYTGQLDIIVGAPVANRNRPDLEGLIGFFVNALAIRVDLDGNPSFRELLRRVRITALDAYAHQELPFEKLVEELNPARILGHTPVFQVMFDLQRSVLEDFSLSGLELEQLVVDNGTAKFDLSLSLETGEQGMTGYFEYNTDLYRPSSIARLSRHFLTLLQAISLNSLLPLSELTLLSPVERRQLLQDWNNTYRDYPLDLCVHQLFEAQAERTPEALALNYRGQELNYQELNRRSNQLAHRLRSIGVGPEVRVGILMERSIEVVVALLATLKAGAAYVPLDPAYPSDRLRYMITDSGAEVLLTQGGLFERLGPIETEWGAMRVLRLDTEWEEMEGASEENPVRTVEIENMAYVLYTSGSTGQPKGVQIQHNSLLNLVNWHRHTYKVSPSDRASQVAGLSFDASVWEIWPYLAAGASLFLIDEDTRISPVRLKGWLIERGITISFIPTPLTERVIATEWPSEQVPLRALLTGGDKLRRYPSSNLGFAVVNHYGVTEYTVVTTAGLVGPEENELTPSIGRPISNTYLYLLDIYGQPVPVGVAGELFMGGHGLARGYINRPDLTALGFLPDPFSHVPGQRLYRSGDLARYRPDSSLEFLGRLDHQVKIRGFRIELGEVEAVLVQHPQVQTAIVVAHSPAGSRPDGGIEKRLVAYLATPGGMINSVELRQHVKLKLPEYMVPAQFVQLEELPLTPNGKVDRNALPAPEEVGAGAEGAEYVGPQTLVEELVSVVWAEVLGAERVSVRANFFELGGHSLLATQVVSRLREVLEVEVPINLLFVFPTVAGLSRAIDAICRTQQTDVPPLPLVPVDRREPLPLSFAQQRLWFLEYLQAGSGLFHMPAAMRLEGPLDTAALQQSLEEIVRRHETLRTTFRIQDGEPVNVFTAEAGAIDLPVIELSGLSSGERENRAMQFAAEEAQRGFDLICGPLLRANLLRMGDEEHILLVTIHHIVSDGWSMGVLIREVAALYDAFTAGAPSPLAPLPIQYADYAAWQHKWLQGEVLEAQLNYWKQQLQGELSVLNLPLDYARPEVQTFRGARHLFSLSAELTAGLKSLSHQAGATIFMTLLSGFQALLQRYSGQDEVITGTLIANRNRIETEGLIGFFINALVMRTDFSGDPSFLEVLERVRSAALSAYAYQDLPFEKLVEALQPDRDLSRTPLFQVMFVLQNVPMQELQLQGLKLTPISIDTGAVAYDLTLSLSEHEETLTGWLEYNTGLFKSETIKWMVQHFRTLLENIVENAAQPLSPLSLMTENEVQQLLVEWNQTKVEYPLEQCFHELFEQQVERTPEAVAVVSGQARLTYRELNARANRLARALINEGAGPEIIVAFLMRRDIEFLTAMLAVFKAGSPYLPLDSLHPASRLAQIIARSRCTQVLATEAFRPVVEEILSAIEGEIRPQLLVLEELLAGEGREENLPLVSAPANLAYVLFTSGSTGVPKGAMVEQAGMVNHLYAKISQLELTGNDVIAQNASQCFDISVWQFLAALLVGGQVNIIDDEIRHEPLRLLETINDDRVTILEIVPSLLQAMLEEIGTPAFARPQLPALRWLIATGEALPPELVGRWLKAYPQIPMLNAYGPTECSDDVTHHPIGVAPANGTIHMPIGRPVANMRMYVLDRHLSPAAIGTGGELYAGGVGVGRGYLHDAARTAEVFVPDPFALEPGARLYKTGDLVSWLPDGDLAFIGRMDQQVKVRGFRIELGEIESIMRQHAMVQDAVVLAAEDTVGDKRLIGYIVPERAEMEDQGAVRHAEHLSQWQLVFDGVYTQAANLPEEKLNLSGWDSSYTGEPIPEEEMREWVDSTVARILSLKPKRVLEIGCGAGLLLLRVAPHCTKYWGTDFAPESLQYVRDQLDTLERGITGVELFEQRADNFEGIADDSFDAVVINSVAQYFPSIEYLLTVLEGAVKAVAPGGFVYVGDIRNLRMLEAFHLSIQLHKAEPGVRREELRWRVLQQIAGEDELVVEPNFFHALKQHLPKIGQVQVHLKRGRHHNELTRFRYDVVLRIGETESAPPDVSWLDWGEQKLTVSSLRQLLGKAEPEVLRLAHIPNARIQVEAGALKWMAGGDGPDTAGELWKNLRSQTEPGIDPEDLRALGLDLPYDVEISGARSDAGAFYDAVCTPRTAAHSTRVPGAAIPQPAASLVRIAWREYANNPLQGVVSSDLIPHVREYLKEKLPEYMVPSVFITLASLPLTPNGKIDRRALPKPDRTQHQTEQAYVAPGTFTEEAVASIWKQVLGVNQIGVNDRFFDIGGDSLKLIRAFRVLNETYPNAVTVVDLFQYSTIALVSAHIDESFVTSSSAPSIQGFEM